MTRELCIQCGTESDDWMVSCELMPPEKFWCSKCKELFAEEIWESIKKEMCKYGRLF